MMVMNVEEKTPEIDATGSLICKLIHLHGGNGLQMQVSTYMHTP